MIDVAIPWRQETGALVAGELALSGTYAHTAVHPVSLSKLHGRAGSVFEDVLARVEEVHFAFPGWPQEAFPVFFLENGDGFAPASYGPIAGNLVDLQTLDGHGDVCGDVEGWGFGGVVVGDVLCESSGEVSGKVGCVMRVGAGFAAGYRDPAVGVRARHVVGKVQVQQFGGQGATVRRGVGGRGVDG